MASSAPLVRALRNCAISPTGSSFLWLLLVFLLFLFVAPIGLLRVGSDLTEFRLLLHLELQLAVVFLEGLLRRVERRVLHCGFVVLQKQTRLIFFRVKIGCYTLSGGKHAILGSLGLQLSGGLLRIPLDVSRVVYSAVDLGDVLQRVFLIVARILLLDL